jgi:hypothetical protein
VSEFGRIDVLFGLAAGVAIPYLIELRLRADPNASPVGARNIGTAVNVGALGLGPLAGDCLAERAPQPLTLPYLVMVALRAVALIGLATAPETGTPAPRAAVESRPAGPARVRLPAPAAGGTIAAFAASGLFAGLSGLILATTLHQTSHALSGGDTVPGLHGGRGSPAVNEQATGVARTRARHGIHDRRPGADRRCRPSFPAKPGAVPHRGVR